MKIEEEQSYSLKKKEKKQRIKIIITTVKFFLVNLRTDDSRRDYVAHPRIMSSNLSR